MSSAESVGINVIVPNRHHGICQEAEPRLEVSLHDEALIVVNDLMLVKACGDTVGLPLHGERLQGGDIQLASWYEINYTDSTQDEIGIIREAFIAGETRVNLPGITRWHMLRPVAKERLTSTDDITERINKAVGKLAKDKSLPNSIDRQTYFDDNMLYFKRVRELGIGIVAKSVH